MPSKALADPGAMPLGMIIAISYCDRHMAEVAQRDVAGCQLDRAFFALVASCEECKVEPYNDVALKELVGKVAFGPADSIEMQQVTGAVAFRLFMELLKKLEHK